jgi:3-oxoacyl-[acyl-carrier-protein] synthase-3
MELFKKTSIIKSIEYYLPDNILTNEKLVFDYPEWSIDKIEKKTGIKSRHIVNPDECSSDIGLAAAKKLFSTGVCEPKDIDYLILCTQSPDYFLPTTACILQERLGIPVSSGAIDINLGCSGYIYGLGLAKGLIETGQSENLLFITAETYSKFIHPGDKSVRTLFGDGAAATLISGASKTDRSLIGPFVYGTDGKGENNLIVPNGGMRSPFKTVQEKTVTDNNGNIRTQNNLYMNGSEIFTFTLKKVPEAVRQLLKKTNKKMEEIDYFIFHQANKLMLEHLRKKIKIPLEKFCLAYEDVGNTVSSSIPIALKKSLECGKIKSGDLIMLVGFGVGYSWGATLIEWRE